MATGVVIKALDLETETKTEAPWFDTEAETELALYIQCWRAYSQWSKQLEIEVFVRVHRGCGMTVSTGLRADSYCRPQNHTKLRIESGLIF